MSLRGAYFATKQSPTVLEIASSLRCALLFAMTSAGWVVTIPAGGQAFVGAAGVDKDLFLLLKQEAVVDHNR